MAASNTLCFLDYLIGTLATAYKGLITSLVVKDFCIVEEEGEAALRGTILSMPEGRYQASLMHEGTEISRAEFTGGFFELRTGAATMDLARNLQIDITQGGRHIGTFLLKRERPDDFFVPAMELSREIGGVNFRLLTSSLEDKPGLLRTAEDVVSQIVSTKRDWKRFSEEILGFSKDLFWYDRDSYYRWYEILVRYALRACENSEPESRERPAANVLSLMELPLGKEADQRKLRELAETWLREMRDITVDLSCRYVHAERVIGGILARFPDMELETVLTPIIESLKLKVKRTPLLGERLLKAVSGVITSRDMDKLGRYSEEMRGIALEKISAAGAMVHGREYLKALGSMGAANAALPDDSEMIDAFFDVIVKNIARGSAAMLAGAADELFSLFSALTPRAHKRAALNIAGLIRALLNSDMAGACETLLVRIAEGASRAKADIFLDPEIASAILRSGSRELIEEYRVILKQILIPGPGIRGFSGETWAEICNPLHTERLSRFLRIISLDPASFEDVLVHVICNLYVGGVFIPDDRIFQREVSSYLNSVSFGDRVILNYLLLQKLPVYYNEVGATGRIRECTTEIDSWGNDPVLYFLRKQVHVNASNHCVGIAESIIRSWVRGDPGLLRGVVPEDVFQNLDAGLFPRYSAAIRPLFEALGVLAGEDLHLERIHGFSEGVFREKLRSMDLPEEVRSKVLLICVIYQELARKYFLAWGGVKTRDAHSDLSRSMNSIRDLRRIITSPERTAPKESLYFKRHIAFGIPSVTGSFNEPKFDAMGETFRQEERVRMVLEEIIAEIEDSKGVFPAGDLERWIYCLDCIRELFDLHDLGNFQVEELLTILKTNTLRLSQIVDMLRMWQRELTWMVGSFHRTFHDPLLAVLKSFPGDELSEHLRKIAGEGRDFLSKAVDIVLREMMNGIAGFLELDRMLHALAGALSARAGAGLDEKVNVCRQPEPDKEWFALDELSDREAMRLAPLIGGKVKNLVYLRNKGLPVPFAVVFSAGWTGKFQEYTGSAHFGSELREAVGKIEERTGTIFGDPLRPLFLSVRSGSYISMPGILSSILYCGLNEVTLKGFIREKKDPWLGWDSCRRFIEHYANVVYELDIRIFEEMTAAFMRKCDVARREDLSAVQMEGLTALYKKELADRNLSIPEDVYEQLRESVKAIYRSWHSGRAVQFRKAMSVSPHWGTSVALMQMICGNERGSGASVFFTREPLTLRKGIYGDTRERSTGSDIAYGKLLNRPLTKTRALRDQRSLEEIDPRLFLLHEVLAERIEVAMRGLPQEVEATYTESAGGGRVIYVLQTRRMEAHRGFTRMFHDICRMEAGVIGRGVGVHGGALSGVATFTDDLEQIRRLKAGSHLPVILLRRMASTDDVSLMSEIDGIITSTGGVASHASVLAQKFDLTAVVGCSDMEIRTDERGGNYAVIGGRSITEGADISMDGSTGLVYSGLCMFTVERGA
jgi:pyruvate,orthophosphate dikinase